MPLINVCDALRLQGVDGPKQCDGQRQIRCSSRIAFRQTPTPQRAAHHAVERQPGRQVDCQIHKMVSPHIVAVHGIVDRKCEVAEWARRILHRCPGRPKAPDASVVLNHPYAVKHKRRVKGICVDKDSRQHNASDGNPPSRQEAHR